MNPMKKSFLRFVVIVVIIAILFVGTYGAMFIFHHKSLDMFLQSIASETDNIPPIMVYGTLYVQGKIFDISQLCRNEIKNSSFKEIFCIAGEKVYFIYTLSVKSVYIWVLACVDLNTCVIENVCNLPNAKRAYTANGALEYKDRSGYYLNGQIVLNDLDSVLIYDIASRTTTNLKYEEYIFPRRYIVGETIDASAIALYIDGNKQIYSFEEMSKGSKSIKSIYEIRNKKTWNGISLTSSLFYPNSIQAIGDKIYALGECLNFLGEAYVVIFEYCKETATWIFVSGFFSGDTISRSCYLVEQL